FRNDSGRAQGVVVTLIDITDRHAIDRQMHLQAAITQGVLDAMDANIAVLDRDGRIVHVNKNWREFAARNAGFAPPGLGVGANYFDVCAKLEAKGASPLRGPDSCLESLRKVL